MDMEQTLLKTFPDRRIFLGGPSANEYWNVPLALRSLSGEIEAAQSLIGLWEPLSERRTRSGEAWTELGLVTACIMLAGHIAEVALKTLIAQAEPDDEPPKGPDGHNLSSLFNRLDPSTQEKIQRRLETMPDYWKQFAETGSAKEVLDIARDNFIDWRYAMEPTGANRGIPKPLLKVAVAITLVGVHDLMQWQASQGQASQGSTGPEKSPRIGPLQDTDSGLHADTSIDI